MQAQEEDGTKMWYYRDQINRDYPLIDSKNPSPDSNNPHPPHSNNPQVPECSKKILRTRFRLRKERLIMHFA